MAIDPTKMAAFAETGPKGPLPPAAKKAEPAPEEPAADDKESDAEEDTAKFDKLVGLFEENAEELEACCDELNPEALLDISDGLPDEDREILMESFGALPDELQDEMIEVLADIEEADAVKIAERLESSGKIEDGERVTAYLVHVGKLIGDGDISHGDDGDGDADDEPEDDAEPDGEEEDDNAAAV